MQILPGSKRINSIAVLINAGVKSLQRVIFSSRASAVCVLHLSAEGGYQAEMVSVLQS